MTLDQNENIKHTITFYEDYEKIAHSSSKQASYTTLKIQFKNLSLLMEEL